MLEVAVVHTALLVLCLFVVNVALFIVWDLYRKRHIFKFSNKLKGYNFYPIIGNVYHFIGKNVHTSIQQMVEKFSLPCNIWIGHEYNYITADANEIKIVLNHPDTIEKSSFYDNFRLCLGNSLLMAKADIWRKNRKIFAKSFSQPMLNSFVKTFYSKSCILVQVLNEDQGRDKFDIFDRFSMDNFCTNLIRLDLNTQVDMNDETTSIISRLQDVVGKRMLSSYFFPEFLWFYTTEGKISLNDLNKLKDIIYGIIQKRRNIFPNNEDYRESCDKLPLMDIMLDGKDGVTFSDEEIFNEIFLFLLAATDTSGITLAFTFTLLGMNQEVQEKVYQEVIRQVGVDGPIVYADLPNLKYTEQAIFESMRPVIPIVVASDSYRTRVLPSGSNILVSIFNLHRSEAYWKDPLTYNPDRFSPEEVSKRHPYTFIPFSSGQRNCIGMKYALMMIKTAVAEVIRSFHVKSAYRSVEELKLESCVTMKTVHELDCRFIPRKMEGV